MAKLGKSNQFKIRKKAYEHEKGTFKRRKTTSRSLSKKRTKAAEMKRKTTR